MKKTLFYFAFFLLSCGKEPARPPISTIYPLPYLPVYPGSWWRYLDENGDTVIYTTESDYVEHSYKAIELDGNYTDPVRVPIWNGMPVYGYSSPVLYFPQQPGQEGAVQVGFLSEHTGDSFTTNSYKGYAWREVGSTDTSILVNGRIYNHVIRVNSWSESSFYNLPKRIYAITYYAKDIGLIKEEDTIDTTITVQLIDFYINH